MARKRKTATKKATTKHVPKRTKKALQRKAESKATAQQVAAQHRRADDAEYLGDVVMNDEMGSRRTGLTPAEHAKRRSAIEEMLAHNVHTSDIVETMVGEFGMTAQTVRNTVVRIRQRWREVNLERRGDYKLMAEKRLLKTIAAARKAKDYSAVFSGERLLADIQGTKEAVRIDIDVNATMRHAVEVSLAGMKPEQIRAFAQDFRQRRRRLGVGRDGTVRDVDHDDVIDAQVEEE